VNLNRKNKRSRWALVAFPVVSLALVAGACGSDNNSSSSGNGTTSSTGQAASVTCASGSISGAGSTFVQTIAQQWIKDYAAACPGATVNYQGVGSGAGIQQFTAGTVDFAGSDVAMKPEEQTAAEAKWGPVVHIPWAAGGIAVEYNVKGVTDLKLSPTTLAGIFAGKITKWDDAAVKADNSGATLPSTGIQVVHRSDGSGTTAAFTAYLTAAAPTVWTAGSNKDVPWPTGQGAKGSDGVTAAVKQTDGSIGYAEVSFAKGGSLGMAKIKNPAGQWVAPDGPAVAAALAAATVPADLKIKINYAPTDPNAYPISTTTFVIVPQKPADAAKGKLLKAFIAYALTKGQQSADGLSYAPLPSTLVTQAKAAVDSIVA
jgi:phosphate transport system substrate-binding protein